MSENRYREYLSDDEGFYRRYLTNEDEPVGSSFLSKLGLTAGVAVGVAVSARKAYESGMLRGAFSRLIDNLSQYRDSEGTHLLNSIRSWADGDEAAKVGATKGLRAKIGAFADHLSNYRENYMDPAIRNHREQKRRMMGSPFSTEETPLIMKVINEIDHVSGRALNNTLIPQEQREELSRRIRRQAEDEMLNRVRELQVTYDQQRAMMKRTGYRIATVRDMLNSGVEIDSRWRRSLQSYVNRFGEDFLNKVADPDIFISENNRFADLRGFKGAVGRFMDSAAEDFTIPFVKINPLRMFYLNEFTKTDRSPTFAILKHSDKQPVITGGASKMGRDLLFMNGRVLDLNDFDESTGTFRALEDSGYLIPLDRRSGPIARGTRSLFNLSTVEFIPPTSGFRKGLYNISKPDGLGLDIGFQEDRIGARSDIGDVSGPAIAIARRMHQITRPYEARVEMTSNSTRLAFGESPEYLFMRRYRSYDESESLSDYFGQFWVSRERHQHVTSASFYSYIFFERLNSTLGQVGLGLSQQNMGSPHAIFGNLVARRIAPVLLGVEAFKYSNYIYENIVGDEFEDQLAQGFASAQLMGASVRDALGLTDVFSNMGDLMPGFEFISELPIPVLTTEGMTPIMIRDILPLDKSREELEAYYESGVEPVRRGRYWEFGNTPLVGGRVDYFQPNWYRRITSDYEYTDTLWGSKNEYWANSPLPTPTHPFSPIRHFITDPYHWEEKHYESRPFMLTGGIPAIEEFPLIGGILNATVGQILKPQRAMHADEWYHPNAYKESDGYEIARMLGIVENEPQDVSFGMVADASSSSLGAAAVGGPSVGAYYPSAQYGSSEIESGEQIAYVTASGNIQVMRRQGDWSIEEINERIKSQGIAKTGQAAMEFSEPYPLPSVDGLEAPNPIGLQATMMDLHYNMTEMGGFYGWVSTMPTRMTEREYEPRIETSISAFGYERAFWDLNLGNMGSDANEIFRRFLPRDAHKNYVNTIKNQMPTWMPGEEYFTDFQRGDPYSKVFRGEMRLPGESYERLYGIDSERIDRLWVGASQLGEGPQEIINTLLHRNDQEDEETLQARRRGVAWRRQWERQMEEEGIALQMNTYVSDEEMAVSGFIDLYGDHQDVLDYLLDNAVDFTFHQVALDGGGMEAYGGFYEDGIDVLSLTERERESLFRGMIGQSPRTILNPRTVDQEEWQDGSIGFSDLQRANFYAQQTGVNIHYTAMVDPDDPEGRLRVQAFQRNPELLDYSYGSVQIARAAIQQMIDDRAIGRGDLYDPIHRFRILADVAPYSQEYRQMRDQLSLYNFTDAEREEIREIRSQVTERGDRVRTYDYRFSTAEIDTQTVTVTRILNNNMFMTEEYPDNPIRFAGVYIPTGQDDPIAQEAREIIQSSLRPGSRIRISVTADEMNLINNDTYRTISAVVRPSGIQNLNQSLIERGLAKEREDDSPAGIYARFTPAEIAFGSMWESFAHMDTPFHTVLLQVRSPLEQYERREVFGKDWQSWDQPISDFAIPWYQNWISKNPVGAVALGAFMGSQFGTNNYGRIVGALIGATTAAIGAGYTSAYELVTGDRWIPQRRRDERDLEEYIDILEYVKNRALYREAADEAKRVEGFDVESYIRQEQFEGDLRKQRIHVLEGLKRQIVTQEGSRAAHQAKMEAVRMLEGVTMRDDVVKAINAEIRELQNTRHVEALTPIAAEAMSYYLASERTMYGYDPGDPISHILSALPRKDRDYLTKFIAAPERERERILGVVPDYMRRVLQSTWGMEVDPKPDLVEYFQERELPDADWVGWDPRASLEDIRVKLVKREGLDNSEFNIWPDDVERADRVRDDIVPEFNVNESADVIARRLHDILGRAGVEELDIQITPSERPGIEVDMDIAEDRRRDVIDLMNQFRGFASS